MPRSRNTRRKSATRRASAKALVPVSAAPASRPPSTNGHAAVRALANDAAANLFSSSLVGRIDFARRAGITFRGRRSTYETLGYTDNLSIADYRERYQRGGIAERIVEAYPFATWAGGARIVEDENVETETPFERSVRLLFSRFDIWSRLTRADVLSCLGHYSALLIGAPGAVDSPLTSASRIGYLKPVAEDNARIQSYVEDKLDPRYGLPLSYAITVRRAEAVFETAIFHYTRVIHVAEGLLEDDIYGKPRLRAIWNHLDDLDKIIGGGAEAAWKRMDPGLQVDVDPTVEMGEAEEEMLSAELEEYQHDLRRLIRTRGTKINPLATQVQGFGPNADSVLKLISATTGIPHRILTGSERGELASTQDRFNWSDRINERRRGFATPLVRALIGRFIDVGLLPPPAGYEADTDAPVATSSTVSSPSTGSYPGGYDIVWPEVGDVSATAKADMANKIAAAVQALSIAGLPPLMTVDEIRHLVFGLGPLDEVALTKLAKLQSDIAAIKLKSSQDAMAANGVALPAPPNKATGNDAPSDRPFPPSGSNTPSAPAKGGASSGT